MGNRQTSKISSIQPVEGDLFTEIHGIGAGIELRLHNAGILTYAQLAALDPQRIAALLGNMVGITSKRIADQDWVGQAKKLTVETIQDPISQHPQSFQDDTRQHYEMFSVEFLLDEMNQVRRTKIIHSQSKRETNWAGWDERRLLNTIIEGSGLAIYAGKEMESGRAAPAGEKQTSAKTGRNLSPLRGELSIQDLEVLMEGRPKPSGIIRQDQAYKVHLTLDLSRVGWPQGLAMQFKATVYARDPGGVDHHTVGTASGIVTQADKVSIQIDGASLPVGVYRLEAIVSLGDLSGKPAPGSELMSMLEAGLLQVY